jgi:hypothetical protein
MILLMLGVGTRKQLTCPPIGRHLLSRASAKDTPNAAKYVAISHTNNNYISSLIISGFAIASLSIYPAC